MAQILLFFLCCCCHLLHFFFVMLPSCCCILDFSLVSVLLSSSCHHLMCHKKLLLMPLLLPCKNTVAITVCTCLIIAQLFLLFDSTIALAVTMLSSGISMPTDSCHSCCYCFVVLKIFSYCQFL